MEQINMNEYQDIKTPCYIFDKEELQRSIEGFQQALENQFQQTIVGYSVKTNSVPYCLHQLPPDKLENLVAPASYHNSVLVDRENPW